MDSHQEIVNSIRSNPRVREMLGIGFLSLDEIDVENGSITFGQKFGEAKKFSLDAVDDIQNHLSHINAQRLAMGYNSGYVLDPKDRPRIYLNDRMKKKVRSALGMVDIDNARSLSDEHLAIHGIYGSANLENLSNRGYRVVVSSFSPPDEKQLAKVQELLGSRMASGNTLKGLAFASSGGATFVTATNINTKKQLSEAELLAELGTKRGVDKNATPYELWGKYSKRVRGLVQKKALTAEMVDKKLKVVTYDPNYVFRAMQKRLTGEYETILKDRLGKNATPAQIADSNEKAAEQAAKFVRAYVDGSIIDLGQKNMLRSLEAANALRVGQRVGGGWKDKAHMQQFRKQLSYLRRGGMANVRLSGGYENLDVGGALDPGRLDYDIPVNGQIKGNIRFNPDADNQLDEVGRAVANLHQAEFKDFRNVIAAARAAGGDILISLDNITEELPGFGSGLGRSSLSISPFTSSGVTRTNATMLAAHPYLVDIMGEVGDYAKNNMDREFRELSEGRLSPGMREHLRSLGSYSQEDVLDLGLGADSTFAKSVQEARAITGLLDRGGSIHSSERYTSIAKRAIKSYYTQNKGKMSMIIPGAHTAEILSQADVLSDKRWNDRGRAARGKGASRQTMFDQRGLLRDNFITVDELSGAYVFGGDAGEVAKILELGGGADFDDSFAGVFRYVKDGKEFGGGVLQAFMYRDPTALGEVSSARMTLDDPFLRTMIMRDGKDDVIAAPLIKGIEGLEARREELRRQLRYHGRRTKKGRREQRRSHKGKGGRAPKFIDTPNGKSSIEHIRGELDHVGAELARLEATLKEKTALIAERIFSGHIPNKIAQKEFGITGVTGRYHNLIDGTRIEAPDLMNKFDLDEAIKAATKGLDSRGVLSATEQINKLLQVTANGGRGLGEYINAAGLLDTIVNEYANPALDGDGKFLIGEGRLDPKKMQVLMRETAIDSMKQEARGAEILQNQVDEWGDDLAAAIIDIFEDSGTIIKLPYYSIHNDSPAHNKMPRSMQERIDETLKAHESGALSLANATSTKEDDLTANAFNARMHEKLVHYADLEASKIAINPGDRVSSAGEEGQKAVKELLEIYDKIAEDNKFGDKFDMAGDEVVDEGRVTLANKRNIVNDDFMAEILGTARQEAERRGISGTQALRDVATDLTMSAREAGVLGTLESLNSSSSHSVGVLLQSSMTYRHLQSEARAVSSGHTVGPRVDTGLSELIGFLDDTRIPEAEIMGIQGTMRERARETGTNISEWISGWSSPKMVNMREGLSTLSSMDMIRRGTIATAAVAAASIIYQRSSDRSEQDMAGPEFLPGGSPYETGVPTRGGMDISGYQFNSSSGTSYTINTAGSYNASDFTARAEALAGAQAYGTIHERPSPFSNYGQAVSNNY